MNLAGKRRARLLTTGLLLLVLVGGAIWTRREVLRIWNSLDVVILAQLRTTLGRQVAVGRIEYKTPGRLVLTDVAIPGDSGGPPVVTIGAVTARYRWADIWQRRLPPLESVTKVLLEDIHLRANRDAHGHLNLLDLLPKKKAAQPTLFRGIVRVRNLRVDLRDRYRTGGVTVANRLAGVSGEMDLADYPRVRLQGRGQVPGSHGGVLRAAGYVDVESKDWLANLHLEAKDLGYWYGYLGQPALAAARPADAERASVVGGRLVADVTLGNTATTSAGDDARPALDWDGTATVEDLELGLAGQSDALHIGRATLKSAGPTVEFDARGAWSEVALTARGAVNLAGEPRGDAKLSLANITPATLLKLAPENAALQSLTLVSPAKATLEAQFQGREVRASGTLELPAGRYERPALDWQDAAAQFRLEWRDGALAAEGDLRAAVARLAEPALTLSGARAKFRLRDDYLEVRDAAGGFGGGEALGRGWADLRARPVQFYAAARLRDVDLAQTPASSLASREISGPVSGDLIVSGDVEDYSARAYLDAGPLQIGDTPVERVSGRAQWNPREGVRIEAAQLVQQRGRGRLWGTISPAGDLDLEATTAGLDLARASAGLLPEGRSLSGRAWVRAHLGGTLAAPTASGEVQAYNLRSGNLELASARGRVEAAGLDSLRLLDWELSLPPARLRIADASVWKTGSETGLADWQATGVAEVDNLLLARAARLAGMTKASLEETPLSGELRQARVAFSGPLSAPRLEVQGRLSRVAAADWRLGDVNLRARADMGTGRMDLDRETLASDVGRVTLAGRLELPRPPGEPVQLPRTADDLRGLKLSLQVQASHLRPVALLRRRAPRLFEYASVHGQITRLSGEIAGSWSQPRVRLTVQAGDVAVNGVPFTEAAFAARYEPGRASLESLRFVSEGVTLTTPRLSAAWPADGPPKLSLEDVAGRVRLDGLRVEWLQKLWRGSPKRLAGGEEAQQISRWLATFASPGGSLSLALALPTPAARQAAGSAQLPVEATATLRQLTWLGPPVPAGQAPIPTAPITADADLRLSLTPKQLLIQRCDLREPGGATLSLAGQWRRPTGTHTPGAVDLRLTADRLPLSRIAMISDPRARQVLAALRPVQGEIALRAHAFGADRRPDFTVDLDGRDLSIRGVKLADLRVRNASFSGDPARLTLPPTELTLRAPEAGNGGGESRLLKLVIGGYLPFDRREFRVPPEAPRELKLTLPPQELATLQALAPPPRPGEDVTIGWRRTLHRFAGSQGRVGGEVVVGGTGLDLQTRGSFYLRDGGVRYGKAHTQFQDVNIRLELSGDRVLVRQCEGRSSAGGGFVGGGFVTLETDAEGRLSPRLNLTLALNDLRIEETNVATALAKPWQGGLAQATVQTVSPASPTRAAAGRITGTLMRPLISGGVLLQNTRFTPPGGYVKKRWPYPLRPAFDVHVFLGQNCRWQYPLLNLPMTGELRITKALPTPQIRGRLHVQRGVLRLPAQRLKVDGDVIVQTGGEGRVAADRPMVRVDLEGRGRVRTRQGIDAELREYNLIVNLTGGLGGASPARPAPLRESGPEAAVGPLTVAGNSGLRIVARTEPPLPTQKVNALVRQQIGLEGIVSGGANEQAGAGQQLQQLLFATGGSAVVGGLTRSVEELFQLESLSLDLGGARNPVVIRGVKRILGELYIAFSQTVGGATREERQQLELYYRLTPRLRFGYRDDRLNKDQILFFGGALAF